jgi:hypothetical protein
VFEKARSYWSDNGTLQTIGAGASYAGREINRTCDLLDQLVSADRGGEYPLRLRLKVMGYGMSAHTYVWLGLVTADADTYLCSMEPVRRMNRGHITPLHNKYVFQLATEPYVGSLPSLVGRVDGGQFRPVGQTDSTITETLSEAGRLVLKPITGGKGAGIAVIESIDGELRWNGEQTDSSSIAGLLADCDGMLIVSFVPNHEYADRIFPDATNTVRIHSVVDTETRAVSLVRGLHRFGSERSAPTDNWSRGGYLAPIDIETGTVRPLVVRDGLSRTRLDQHPGTGARVAGVEIPHWDQACALVRDAAALHRDAPLVGWDIAVSPDGPVIIEANARPSILGLQLRDGLLTEPAFRKLREQV